MSSESGEFATWLRKQIVDDLRKWRALEAAYLPDVEREGEVLWQEARERADGFEAQLAILSEHESYQCSNPEGLRCDRCASNQAYPSGAAIHEAYPCRTIRLLGSGYKHRPGYREEWRP